MGPFHVPEESDRLLEGAVAARFLSSLLQRHSVTRLLSTDHFSVDGTSIQAWASMKSVKPVGCDDPPAGGVGGRNAETGFRGRTRSNATHASTSDPDARLHRQGADMEARLACLGQARMENDCGLLVDACLTRADGHAERLAALAMIEARADRPVAVTLVRTRPQPRETPRPSFDPTYRPERRGLTSARTRSKPARIQVAGSRGCVLRRRVPPLDAH